MPIVLEPDTRRERRLAAAAEGPTGVVSVPVSEVLPIAEELLDGGEIVLLAIKPSPWFVLFDSARWMVVGFVLLAVSLAPSLEFARLPARSAVKLALLLMVGRLAIAFLRWVSRFYVLTNRRIMRMRGVFKPDILACPLTAVRTTRVSVGPHEKTTNLGTILVAGDPPDADLHWYTISKPQEIHACIRRAIDRACGNDTRND